MLLPVLVFAQKAGLSGKVTDKKNGTGLPFASIQLMGTAIGTSADFDGNYKIENIPPGTYNIQFKFLGYEPQLHTGIKFTAGENKVISVKLSEAGHILDVVDIVGDPPLVDPNKRTSTETIEMKDMRKATTKSIDKLIETQVGVVRNSEGTRIRSSRTYEASFLIDGVSAQDELAGTGFGIDLGTNAVSKVEISTGGPGVSTAMPLPVW